VLRGMRSDGGGGCAGSIAMEGIWAAARAGDLGEVQQLVGQDPGLVNARDGRGMTPLMYASASGHLELVRWLLDKGVAINERDDDGYSALFLSCWEGQTAVVRLLLQRGADLAIADEEGFTPLMRAALEGFPEIVRLLLGDPRAGMSINHRDEQGGETVLWHACYMGRGGIVRALLESGADPRIADNEGITPMAIAKQDPDADYISAEGRRECVAALEVSCCLFLSPSLSTCSLRPVD
jgi:uncharacterized protein